MLEIAFQEELVVLLRHVEEAEIVEEVVVEEHDQRDATNATELGISRVTVGKKKNAAITVTR